MNPGEVVSIAAFFTGTVASICITAISSTLEDHDYAPVCCRGRGRVCNDELRDDDAAAPCRCEAIGALSSGNFFWPSLSTNGFNGHEQGIRLSDRGGSVGGINSVLASVTDSTFGREKEDREILALRPGLEEVAIMGAVRVARLARGVGADRAVPVARVGDDPERGAGGLVVVVGGAVDGVAVSAAGQRTEVEPGSQIRARRRRSAGA